jgi:D-galactarolactone cycloisomerase
LKIADIEAFAVSVPVENGPQLAVGAVKRDAVIVKVTSEDGLVGYGESHHARSANIIAGIVNTTLKDIILPSSAHEVVRIWSKVYD